MSYFIFYTFPFGFLVLLFCFLFDGGLLVQEEDSLANLVALILITLFVFPNKVNCNQVIN